MVARLEASESWDVRESSECPTDENLVLARRAASPVCGRVASHRLLCNVYCCPMSSCRTRATKTHKNHIFEDA